MKLRVSPSYVLDTTRANGLNFSHAHNVEGRIWVMFFFIIQFQTMRRGANFLCLVSAHLPYVYPEVLPQATKYGRAFTRVLCMQAKTLSNISGEEKMKCLVAEEFRVTGRIQAAGQDEFKPKTAKLKGCIKTML